MSRRSILVITDDAIGPRMAGPAIRAWHVADALADDHDVRLASTRRAEGSSRRFLICDGAGGMLPGLAVRMDVVVVQGFTLRANPWIAQLDASIVVDLYDPVHLEILEGAKDSPSNVRELELAGALEAIRVQAERGDFFMCASERQRDLWLGHLSALGRVNFRTYEQDSTLRKLIDVVPFGVDPIPVGDGGGIKGAIDGIELGDFVLLWAGGVYNWFDPLTLIDAVGDLVAELPRLRLVFMGTKHPSLDDLSTVVLRQAIDLAETRGLLGSHVFFLEGWVPYAERGRFLADADIGVSTHLLHAETAYSFRTRMLDYLWAELPIVCTDGDEFATVVRAEGLGLVVAERDRPGLAAALHDLITDPEQLAQCRAKILPVAARYSWSVTLRPVVTYVRDAARAPDRSTRARPGGMAAKWGIRFDNRTAWAQEYIAINGWRRFVRIGLVRSVQRGLRVIAIPLRPLSRRLPNPARARLRSLTGA